MTKWFCSFQQRFHCSLNLLGKINIARYKNVVIKLTNSIRFATLCWLWECNFSMRTFRIWISFQSGSWIFLEYFSAEFIHCISHEYVACGKCVFYILYEKLFRKYEAERKKRYANAGGVLWFCFDLMRTSVAKLHEGGGSPKIDRLWYLLWRVSLSSKLWEIFYADSLAPVRKGEYLWVIDASYAMRSLKYPLAYPHKHINCILERVILIDLRCSVLSNIRCYIIRARLNAL